MGGARRDEFDEAFDDLFERAHRAACRVLDFDEAEDAAAEALARAYLHWDHVRQLPYREAWVARVAANVALDCLRRAHRWRGAVPRLPATPPRAVDDVAEWLPLLQAIERLPKRQRDVMVMRYIVGLTQAQVATQLGVEPATVKEHADRARAALRRTLGNGWEDHHAVV